MHPPLRRRDFLEGLALLLSASRLHAQSHSPSASTDLARSIAGAANNLLAVLRPELRRQLEFAFDDPERKDWSNVPHFVHPCKGLRFGELNEQERTAAHRLLQAILSSQGYDKALAIMARDEFLGAHPRPGQAAGTGFGWEFYFLDVFGKPGSDAPWGVQLDGHHCAVNLTVIDNAVTVTPTFMGAEPALIPSGPHAGWRALSGEWAKGLALLQALTPDQTRQAVLSETVPGDIFTGPGREDALKSPAGASALQGRQRDLLESLVDEYLGNIPAAVARDYRSAIQSAGFDTLHFAWMGPADVDQPVYYRVHSPVLLIEYDNAKPLNPASGGNANHIHTILRVPGNDFGDDWLRRHRQQHPHA